MKPISMLCLAWLTACLIGGQAGEPKSPVRLAAARVQRGDVLRFITLPGVVKPWEQATLCAKVPGYLKRILVDKGDTVKSGQLLAELEAPELAAEHSAARADVGRVQAEMRAAEIELQRLSKGRQQSPDLVLPQAVDAAEARVALAKAGLEGAQSRVLRAEALLGFTQIAAPFDGVVTARFVDPGAFIPAATSANAASGAAMVTVMQVQRVRVQVPIPENESALAAMGQPVRLSFEGLPGKGFEAVLSRIAYALDEATKTMLAEVDMDNAMRTLRPGMYATARVGVERHVATLWTPVEALVMEKTAAFVFKVVDGRARKQPVKLGFNDGAKAELLQGAAEGEKLLLVGKTPLVDGAAVTVSEER